EGAGTPLPETDDAPLTPLAVSDGRTGLSGCILCAGGGLRQLVRGAGAGGAVRRVFNRGGVLLVLAVLGGSLPGRRLATSAWRKWTPCYSTIVWPRPAAARRGRMYKLWA
ncbi:unnamed protein product, partial [Symbiodinium pilosum]